MSQKPTKGQLLAHYAKRPVTRFHQYDGFKLEEWDCVLDPDEHGYSVMGGETHELMHGANVRVLIRPDTSREDAVELLERITRSVRDSQQSAADCVDDECSRCGAGSQATHADWCEQRDGTPVLPALALRRLANWVGENDCKEGTVATALRSIAQEIAATSPELAFLPSSGSAADDEIPFD